MDFLDDDKRRLRIVGRMPLASASDLDPVVGADEADLRERMQGLRSAGWLASVRRGMLRRAQDRWLLTLRSVEALYARDHAHPDPREIARAGGLQRLLAGERPPQSWIEFLALDHEHLAHLEDARFSPFAPLEDLRTGGYFHAVSRYGERMWTTFTYVGKHVTERAMRRKYAHRFWGLDCYIAVADRTFRISNRVFYETPDQTAKPSAQIIVAADAWAASLASRICGRDVPTLDCTPDGSHSGPVVARWSRDLVSDPAAHPSIGRPETMDRWWRGNSDLEAIRGPADFRLFMKMASSWHQRISPLV